MTANRQPIYTLIPDVQWATSAAGLSANTTRDMTSGTTYQVWNSQSADGGYLDTIYAQPLGTNVQTVMRLWMNNGSTTGTAANNILIGEYTMGATTSSEILGLFPVACSVERPIPSGYKVYATFGTAVAAGFALSGWGGKYS